MKKRHILTDKKWHAYAWVYKGKGKTVLYVDGKPYRGKEGITVDYFFRGGTKNGLKDIQTFLDELRISKCARRKITRKEN